MVTENYLPDPELEAAMRICRDESGLWYIFRADGREYVYDSLDELATDYAKLIVKKYAAA